MGGARHSVRAGVMILNGLAGNRGGQRTGPPYPSHRASLRNGIALYFCRFYLSATRSTITIPPCGILISNVPLALAASRVLPSSPSAPNS
jgi:hypothetical protein